MIEYIESIIENHKKEWALNQKENQMSIGRKSIKFMKRETIFLPNSP
jgi:hypothetical protein